MKRLFILSIALAAMTGMASAQSYYMNVKDAKGETARYKVENIKRVTIVDDAWQAYAVGDYDYALGMFGSGITASGLTLYRSEAHPDQWKIGNWANGMDFLFSYDEDSGEIHVQDQSTEVYNSMYGQYVWVCEATDLDPYYTSARSYFDSGTDTFNFAIGYYISFGFFYMTGYNMEPYETFAISEYLTGVTAEMPKPGLGKMDLAPSKDAGLVTSGRMGVRE